MPCFNEENHIAQAVESLTDEFVHKNAEILIVDGMSTDNTILVVDDLIEKKFPVKLLLNPDRLQCFALNLAIATAEGKFVVRVDAHSTYPESYVKKLVHLLEATDADNVGGMMLPEGKKTVQKAIAQAMQHPVGVGDAKFHLGNYRGYVDTVYLGAFRKCIFDSVGYYDTNCRTNEDAELNIRILKNGGKIYLDSSIRVEYLPRDSFAKLAVQYYRYGKGRAYTTVKHRRFTSMRQLAPPLLVMGLAISVIAGLFNPLFFLVWGGYAAAVMAAALFTGNGRRTRFKLRFLMGIAFMIMHTAWGTGFIRFFTFDAVRYKTKTPTSTY